MSIDLRTLDQSRVRISNIEVSPLLARRWTLTLTVQQSELYDRPLTMKFITKPLAFLVASVLLTYATCAIASPLPQPRDGPSNGPPGGLGAPAVSLGGLTNLNSLLPGLGTLSLVSLPPTTAAGLTL